LLEIRINVCPTFNGEANELQRGTPVANFCGENVAAGREEGLPVMMVE
jgi:hypothetical protein